VQYMHRALRSVTIRQQPEPTNEEQIGRGKRKYRNGTETNEDELDDCNDTNPACFLNKFDHLASADFADVLFVFVKRVQGARRSGRERVRAFMYALDSLKSVCHTRRS